MAGARGANRPHLTYEYIGAKIVNEMAIVNAEKLNTTPKPEDPDGA